MSKSVQDARFLIKRTSTTGLEPAMPPNGSDDHTEGWLSTYIYEGELYLNSVDKKLWIRTEDGITELAVYDIETGLIPEDHLPSSTYDTELDSNLVMPNAIGGFNAGTAVNDIYGRTFIEMFDDLLFPTIDPTYTSPSSTFAKNVSTLQIIGDSISITFTDTLQRGTILINGVFSNYRSGVANSYNYTGTSLSSSSSSGTQSISGYGVVIGYQSWKGNVSYDKGPQPTNNKGREYNDDGVSYTSLAASTTSYITQTIEGVYPIFATTSSITTMTQQSLYSMKTANNIQIVMVGESSGNKQQFDIPNAWLGSPTNRSLSKIALFNSVSGKYENDLLSNWTTGATTHTIEGKTINYTKYKNNSTERGTISVQISF